MIFSFSVNSFAYDYKPGGWKESDIPAELANPVPEILNKIRSGSDEDFFSKQQDIEAVATSLNNIQDLDTAGRQKQLSEGELINSIILDSTSPGIGKHAKDAKDIAQATAKLLKNLTQGLKQHNDIDCVEYQADPAIANSYFLQKSQRRTNYMADEPFLCEHLRNTYNCEDNLEIHCLQFSSRPEDMQLINANFPYKVEKGLIKGSLFRSYKKPPGSNFAVVNSFANTRFEFDSTKESYLKNGALIYKKYTQRLELVEINATMSFNSLLDPAVLANNSIIEITYTGYMLVTLNGKTVFVGPGGGSTLTDLSRHNEVLNKTDTNMLVLEKFEYYIQYPVISNGCSNINLGKGGNPKNRASINLKPYLQKGYNTLVIKAYAANEGKVDIIMKTFQQICNKWSEPKWNETCVLQAN